jgi:hypothetical protein
MLVIFQLSAHLSHSSYSSFVPSQHSCSESTILQYSEHLPSSQFFLPWSHSSHASSFPFQQDHLQFLTSFVQFEQFSASSMVMFQQNAVQFLTSVEQFLQSSHSSMIPFQHSQGCFHSVIQISHKSSGQVSHFSFLSFLLLGHVFISLHSLVQL